MLGKVERKGVFRIFIRNMHKMLLIRLVGAECCKLTNSVNRLFWSIAKKVQELSN